jgi:arsenite methyltransferase
MGLFTVGEAEQVLAELRPVLDELVAVRADAAELAAAVREGASSSLGGLAELKAYEARLDELMTTVQQTGVELKGWAPLLLDFPSDLDGVPVLLCWLEGDPALGWYHRTDLGFLGRRRLPESAALPHRSS